jgi:hypothetical protein
MSPIAALLDGGDPPWPFAAAIAATNAVTDIFTFTTAIP